MGVIDRNSDLSRNGFDKSQQLRAEIIWLAMIDHQRTDHILGNQQRHCDRAAMLARRKGIAHPTWVIEKVIDECRLALSHYPTCQAFSNFEAEAASAFTGHSVAKIPISGAKMQQVIFCVEQHDRSLLCTNGVIEKCQRSIQCTIQIETGGHFCEHVQKRFCILLL